MSVHSSLLVCAPKNWVKGKLLGSGAFGQVREIPVHMDECAVLGCVQLPTSM